MERLSNETTEVIITRRLRALPTEGDFAIRERTLPQEVPPGHVRVRTSHIGLNPGLRSTLRDPDAPVGAPPWTQSVGQIIRSDDTAFPEGSWVHGRWAWARLADAPTEMMTVLGPEGTEVDFALEIGPMGWSGQTAHVGVRKYARPEPGEVMYISSGAGSVGLVAGQLAKGAGAHVIGSAGSPEKLEAMTAAGFDAVFNYKTDPPPAALARLAPDGLDIYYDNVGGDHLQAAFEHMRMHGRIVCCGSVAGYNSPDIESSLIGLRRIVTRRLSIQGFVVWDHDAEKEQRRQELRELFTTGGLIHETQVFHGIERIPEAFISMLEGRHRGQTIVAY